MSFGEFNPGTSFEVWKIVGSPVNHSISHVRAVLLITPR